MFGKAAANASNGNGEPPSANEQRGPKEKRKLTKTSSLRTRMPDTLYSTLNALIVIGCLVVAHCA